MVHFQLNKVDSTNGYLKNLVDNTTVDNWTVVSSKKQDFGKGQRGNVWLSGDGGNALMSVYYKPNKLQVKDAFLLNKWVSLSVLKTLEMLGVYGTQIKWPNDILVNKKKICGILIENTFVGHSISDVIIGIGLNVNSIPKLSGVTALSYELGVELIVKQVIEKLVDQLKTNSHLLHKVKQLDRFYLNGLYGFKQFVKLESENGEFKGRVNSVNHLGFVQIEKENKEVVEFDIQQLKWLDLPKRT
ncbi:MAG: biotin--[acetyl-CoA-carboxylase] ligase [Salibacteraceae bacterium]